jgi:hypothetical protein
MRKLMTLSTLALLTLFSCGGGGGGSSESSVSTYESPAVSNEVANETTVSETAQPETVETTQREVPLTGIIEESKAYTIGNVEIAYAVATTVDNGTAETYGADVLDNGTFTFSGVLAGRKYVLSFFDADGNPVVFTLSGEIEVDDSAEITVSLSDTDGDGIFDDAVVVPKKGAKVISVHLPDQDNNGVPDNIEEMEAFDDDHNGIPECIETLIQINQMTHTEEQQEVEHEETAESDHEQETETHETETHEQVETANETAANETEEVSENAVEEVRELLSHKSYRNYVSSLPRVLASLETLWDMGIDVVVRVKGYDISVSASRKFACKEDGSGGTVTYYNLGNNTYKVEFDNCNPGYVQNLNGNLIVKALDQEKDKIQVTVEDKFGFNTKDDQKAFLFSNGTTVVFEDDGKLIDNVTITPSNDYSGTIKIESFSGSVRLADNYYYYYSFENVTGTADNFNAYSLKNMNLTGKVTFNDQSEEVAQGVSYQLETENLTSTYFAEPLDRETFHYRAVITGTLKLSDNYTVEYDFNATDPETIYTNEITAKVGNVEVEKFWGIR